MTLPAKLRSKELRELRALISEQERQALRPELVAEAWRRGDLVYKLHDGQRGILQRWSATSFSRLVLEIARRWGKTWLLCCVSVMVCLRKPGAVVVYGAPTLKHLSAFILPTLEAITRDAPDGLGGSFNTASGEWRFPNGSVIRLFGCDDKHKADRGRGTGADLAILDEAGFIPLCRYVLKSVLRPQTLHTGGRTLIASTPAEEPDHDFTALAERAESRGNYERATIHDNPLLTEEQIAVFIAEDAADEGMAPAEYQLTDDFRREYMAERVVNKMLVAVPEWEHQRAQLLVERKRPEYFDGLVSLDFGGADPHFALLGYFDFKRAVTYVEEEVFLHGGETTAELAAALKAAERRCWGVDRWEGTVRGAFEGYDRLLANLPDEMSEAINQSAPHQPLARFADHDTQLIRDLYQLHGILFVPTDKSDKRHHVNLLRVAIREGTFEVHPRCKHLDRHLRTTMWKDHRRKDFARKHEEHGDGVDTASYLLRNVDPQRNPYPKRVDAWGHDATPRARPQAPLEDEVRPSDIISAMVGGSRLARRLTRRR